VILSELGASPTGIQWSPDGHRLAVTDGTGAIGIWDPVNQSRLLYARLHGDCVYTPQWSPDGRLLVTGGFDGIINIISAADLTLLRQIEVERHADYGIWETAMSHDGAYIASAHNDSTVHVWETATGREVAILESHRGAVLRVAFSPRSDLLASGDFEETRLWRLDDWGCLATLPGAGEGMGGLAFHPRCAILATKYRPANRIDCWSLDGEKLTHIPVEDESRRYVNAKVVLLGDTGVGKSGLGLVLSGQPYAPTESTHGRNVWVFAPTDDDDHGGGLDTKEVLIWDLAGQPGYRIVHQLHLNQIAVALVVFDARSETNPFAGVKYWTRAIAQARRLEGDAAIPVRTFLVAARADRGGISVTQPRIQAFVEDLGADGFFETSAKEDWQIAELRRALLTAINWDLLPTVSSSALLTDIRTFILDAKQEGRVLATVDDLFRDYRTSGLIGAGDDKARAEFEACLARVESRGLVRRLRFGDFVLLAPELLDSYASALVQAAKAEPDGLGVIAEEDALSARFRLADTQRITSSEQEKLLLIATVEELLRHEIALKETTDRGVDLVFPSQFTRERGDAPHIPGRELTFSFRGSLHNVYATLAVRLARSHLFERREMWRNAATYTAKTGGICGLYLRELEEGTGELDVFFDEAATTTVRAQFETYVFQHLQQRAGPGVSTRRVPMCPHCRYVLPDELVRRKLQRGALTMRCPDCELHVLTLLQDNPIRSDTAVTQMHLNANARRDIDVAATRLKGKVETNDFDVFLCHNSRDKSEVKAIGERLRKRGIHPWLDEWEIPPGTRWHKTLAKQLRSVRSVAVFVGSRAPGPWQDIEIETLLQRFANSNRPLIPVILQSRVGNPRLPDFLTLWQLIDMRKPEPDPFEQLVWGITGEKTRR
jgi:GTPase SAR1 family protein